MCFFFKQKTAYEMRISDWSSDVCSSDLLWVSLGRDGSPCVIVEEAQLRPPIDGGRKAGMQADTERGTQRLRPSAGNAKRGSSPIEAADAVSHFSAASKEV